MPPSCGQRAAVFFYFSNELVWTFEIELSHMGKNKGNPNLVCEKKKNRSQCHHISNPTAVTNTLLI